MSFNTVSITIDEKCNKINYGHLKITVYNINEAFMHIKINKQY